MRRDDHQTFYSVGLQRRHKQRDGTTIAVTDKRSLIDIQQVEQLESLVCILEQETICKLRSGIRAAVTPAVIYDDFPASFHELRDLSAPRPNRPQAMVQQCERTSLR